MSAPCTAEKQNVRRFSLSMDHSLKIESSVLNTVRLFPNRIVPPMSPGLCSGISITTGCIVSGSNSVEFAPACDDGRNDCAQKTAWKAILNYFLPRVMKKQKTHNSLEMQQNVLKLIILTIQYYSVGAK